MVEIAPEIIFHIGPIPITNSLLTTWLVMIVLIALAYFAGKNIKKIPSGLQNFAELVIETLQSTIENIAGDRTKLFFAFLATFFIFIISCNYFGLLPGIGTIGFKEVHDGKEVLVPLLRSPNADLNLTLGLAIISVFLTHYFAVHLLGWKSYLGRFFSLNPVFLFVGILEIISEFTKLISLSFRLFGNIFAGEALLTTISGIFAFFAPLPFMGLELLVGFVQATVFMMLTLVFMSILSEKHEVH
ncbi:MAG TPA: F0F1 ATP synthase subunit A [Candidatus Saccharimonadales bacterium]|nr:F0F1 ATP synthase subunit A [Candidatus Saccharimonadales bacterium]